jgi:hypothetical protein
MSSEPTRSIRSYRAYDHEVAPAAQRSAREKVPVGYAIRWFLREWGMYRIHVPHPDTPVPEEGPQDGTEGSG